MTLSNYKPVYDDRGKLPRFLILDDAVINQYTLEVAHYEHDWLPAYENLYRKYKQ